MEDFSRINVASWLEKQITSTMNKIENNQEDDYLLSILDKYISMRKKYEGSIDPLSETVRVMQEFALFTQQYYPNKAPAIREVLQTFLNSK